jgi:triacylglycerol esterase/lipase EstA (alpha/beta hydrolase family)
VDIVAHSWGGFLARWYIEKLGRAAAVRQLILIGSPMRGTWMGLLGVGATKREMFVGSSTVLALGTAPPAPRYSTLWSDCDEIVVPPQMSLMLDQGGNPGIVRQFNGIGHLTMQRDPQVADLVAALLESPALDRGA